MKARTNWEMVGLRVLAVVLAVILWAFVHLSHRGHLIGIASGGY